MSCGDPAGSQKIDKKKAAIPLQKKVVRRRNLAKSRHYQHCQSMSDFYPAETNDREVTSWIPLTSVWPTSPGCESIYRLDVPSLVAFDPGYGLASTQQ